MSWGCVLYGRVRNAGLVHIVYVEGKEDRVWWTAECGLRWAHRENRDKALAPKGTKARATCLRCLYPHLKDAFIPWPG